MAKLVIEAGRSSKHYWKDLWRYRELFYFLSWRDLLVRYRQTAIGVAWAILQPLLTVIILTVIFGQLAKMHTPGVPDAIVIMAGTLPWQFFANSLTGSSNSIVSNANLISKVYFPRMLVPASSVLVSTVDFIISFVILMGFFLWYQYPPTWRFIFLPPLVLLAFLAALGPGLIITTLNVRYRDFKYIIPFIVQFGMLASPVAYSSSVVAAKFGEKFGEKLGEQCRLLYSLNPTVGVIDGFRWVICGKEPLYWPGFCLSLFVIFALLLIGVIYFRRMERKFADVI